MPSTQAQHQRHRQHQHPDLPAYRLIGPEDVPLFAAELFDANRCLPAVVVSPASDTRTPRVGPLDLTNAVRGMATVTVLASPAAAWALSSHAPGFDVYGGAVRVFMPGASPDDKATDHPLFETYRGSDSAETIAAIAGQLHAYVRTTSQSPSTPRAEKRAAKLHDLHRQLAAVTRDRDALSDRAAELESTITDLRREARRRDTELAELRDVREAANAPVFGAPVDQLRHDVWLHWLRVTSEPERDQQPLRSYTVGRDFCASLTLDGIPRERMLTVVVDVLTKAVFGHPGRHPRQERVAPAPTAKPLTRGDGGVAWRCSVKDRAPAAPRFLWWELPDGSVELGRFVRHDDHRLR